MYFLIVTEDTLYPIFKDVRYFMSILEYNSYSAKELKKLFNFLESRLLFVNLYCSEDFIKDFVKFLDAIRLEYAQKSFSK